MVVVADGVVVVVETVRKVHTGVCCRSCPRGKRRDSCVSARTPLPVCSAVPTGSCSSGRNSCSDRIAPASRRQATSASTQAPPTSSVTSDFPAPFSSQTCTWFWSTFRCVKSRVRITVADGVGAVPTLRRCANAPSLWELRSRPERGPGSVTAAESPFVQCTWEMVRCL